MLKQLFKKLQNWKKGSKDKSYTHHNFFFFVLSVWTQKFALV